MDQSEIWKPIRGYEGHYEVSNLGRVRNSSDRARTTAGYILRQSLRGKYLGVSLWNEYGQFRVNVHRLVAIAFLGLPPENHVVNHINGMKFDNRAENLEWMTIKENIHHAFRTGLRRQSGADNKRAKLTPDEVIMLRQSPARHRFGFLSQMGRRFNVFPSTIERAIKAKTWKD